MSNHVRYVKDRVVATANSAIAEDSARGHESVLAVSCVLLDGGLGRRIRCR
jgi:hypothetical protein